MAFRFYIDGQLTDQPDNWDDLVTTIKRDRELQAQLITQDVTLTYSNNNDLPSGTISGYQYIKNLFDTGVCQQADISIYSQVDPIQTILISKGVIKITQVESDEQRFKVTFRIQDNSFYSYINNNKELKVNLASTKTKNGLNITPVQVYEIDLFNSATGGFGSGVGAYYHGYKARDVFEFIISVITDNQVGFESEYLDALTYPPFIIKGQDIQNPFSIYPTAPVPVYEISFSEIFSELNKCKNLSFYIDTTDPDNPVFKIENTESTYDPTLIYTFEEVLYLKTSVNVDYLYGTVEVGSDILAPGNMPAIYTWEEGTSYYGWKKEVFYPLGQCNRNTSLNLVNTWVLSNNVVQEILVGGSTAYVDNYFLIECDAVDDVAFICNAYPYPYFSAPTPPFYYNFGLNNFNKLQRHSDKFETAFGNFLGVGTLGFRATLASDYVFSTNPLNGTLISGPYWPIGVAGGAFVEPMIFGDETSVGNYDGGNNYDNTTGVYTLPQDGNYSFQYSSTIEIDGIVVSPGLGYMFMIDNYIRYYDAANNLISESTQQLVTLSDGSYPLITNLVINGLTGEYVQCATNVRLFTPVGIPNINVTYLITSSFETTGTPDGSVSPGGANAAIKKYVHEFEYNIPLSDWTAIKANPIGMVEFTKDGVSRQGWIEEINRNDETGKASVKLISSSTENAAI